MKKILILGLSLGLAALVLSGCSLGDVVEENINEATSTEDSSSEGDYETTISADLPSGFPDDVVTFDEDDIVFSNATEDPETGDDAFLVTYEFETEKETVKTEITDFQENNGWESVNISDLGEAVSMQFTKGDRYTTVTISVTDREGFLSVSVHCT